MAFTERALHPMSASKSVLLWFRLDLRLADNPALAAAAATSLPVIPVFVWSPEEDGSIQPGSASRWWLHQALLRLDESLRALGSHLLLRRGPISAALADLAREYGASRIFANHDYQPAALAQAPKLASELRNSGVEIVLSNASLLFDPGSIRTTSGGGFRVFTPFWNACWNQRGAIREPLPAPSRLIAPSHWPRSLQIADFGLEPQIDWAGGIRTAWTPGEAAALERLRSFAQIGLGGYSAERDRPDHDGTSRLSPHLHFGEISPVQIWHALIQHRDAGPFLRQIVWREFAHHLLCENPQTLSEPYQPQFRHFPWRRNRQRLAAWQRGRTGYPIVDAAMRQLWTTGWMHNRARMVVASFLVKHLLIPWQEGAAWFLDTLVDADLANNTMGWQWVAGCGVDAAPYFRVFNPVLQGEKFDPRGDYVREWVPELRELSAEHIHQPWNAPPLALAAAGVRLGDTYPHPIVDHAEARAGALQALEEMKAKRS